MSRVGEGGVFRAVLIAAALDVVLVLAVLAACEVLR